ncbi:hypothetical protein HGRIS_007881 [Hohenbuehelia grisea]|uniref:YDG domain-containing protein n=1 Tax=Hohenbuehelia grisea TaxID=104357 RepID=A0ABR3J6Z6_9AGAR
MAPSAYELKRQANIEQNRKLLMSLALHTPFFEPTEKTTRYVKRKAKADQDEASEQPPAKKRAKVDVESTDNGEAGTGVRRSSRNAGKTADYNAEITRGRELPIAVKAGIRTLSNNGPQGREDGKRLHDPKTYGAIPGVEVGTWWETRQGCSSDAIHAPWVAGIAPGPKGAYSVALSGGYDDDVDLGYAFTYTGSGGRDLKGTKTAPKNLRTAPQSCDQSFENNFNKALKKSVETKQPVRVIRGYKLQSKYAPSEGYRYDGLYSVEKAWIEPGLNKGGYLVCKFAFRRLDNQPNLEVRASEDPDNEKVDENTPSGAEDQADQEPGEDVAEP